MSLEDNPVDDRYQLDQCIDEIKSLQSKITTLTAERDEARKEVENVKLKLSGAWNLVINTDEFARCISSLKTLYGIAAEHAASHETKNAARDVLEVCGVAEKMRDGCVSRDAQIDSLSAELAALKSAPGMEEIDRLRQRISENTAKKLFENDTALDELADLARRSIASREEVVGLLDQMESDIRDVFSDDWCLLDELKNLSRCDTLQPYAAAHRLLAIACCPEIVEGK